MNLDTKVKKLAKNADAMAIIDKYIPGFSTDRQMKLAYGMTLRSLFEFPQMEDYRQHMDSMNSELEALED